MTRPTIYRGTRTMTIALAAKLSAHTPLRITARCNYTCPNCHVGNLVYPPALFGLCAVCVDRLIRKG